MEFITTDQRIAVENFTIGNIYTITFRNAIYFSGSCIGKGADFVSFQRTAPELSFVLTMQTAPTVLLITEGGGGTGTTDYNNLTNKPSINGVTLQGALSLSELDIASKTTVQGLELTVDGISTAQQLDRAALVELVDSGAKNELNITASSGSGDGLTWTVNSDGSITVSGQNTGNSTKQINLIGSTYKQNKYIGEYLSGVTGGSSSTYKITIYYSNNGTSYASENTFYRNYIEVRTYPYCRIALEVASNYEFAEPYTFYPMICSPAAWNISNAYQPYRPSYQDLYDMVKALQ